MSRPKSTKFRNGGRNSEFFHGLKPLAKGIDAIIDSIPSVAGNSGFGDDKVAAAEAKRKKRAYARLRNAGLIPKE